jgi:ATP-binding cassette subfamily F protein 3
MIILNVRDVSFSFGISKILEGVSFVVDSQDRCGVVGINGAGKSTLFALLNGDYEQDGGAIQYARGITRDYLRQNNEYDGDDTIGDAVRRVFRGVLEIEEEMARMEARISSEAGSPLDSLINRYEKLRTEFEFAGGYEYRSRIKGVLNGLDIGEGIDDRTPVSILSGGQKTRLGLALLLVNPPDLLLLDEPTNHLDVTTLEWLESYMKNYRKSLLVVSHDRYFLDAATTRTLEIENRRLTAYTGGYSAYVAKKEEDRVILERQYENQQREIERLESIIEQFRRWNTERSHIMAKSREKALNRIEKIDRPSGDPKKMNIRFNNTVSNSQDALYIDDVSKSYSGRRLFRPFTATVRRNDRIMIIGPNGCGKSTLLRMMFGTLEPDSGCVKAGARMEMNFYDQENFDLDGEKTILSEIYDAFPEYTISKIRDVLGAFLFSGDDIHKRTSSLSGGEKARVALIKLVMSKANMLLLDEPTNYLDINSREKLEEALIGFNGVIISVSHDRYFIRKLATRIFYFTNGRFLDFAGGYNDLLDYLAAHGKTGQNRGAREAAETGGNNTGARETGAKTSWLAARESRSRQKRHETRLVKIEGEIADIEKRLIEIEKLMKSNSVISDHVRLIELSAEKDATESSLEKMLSEWEELSAQDNQH